MARLLTMDDLSRVASMSGDQMQAEYTREELIKLQQMRNEQKAATEARSDSVQATQGQSSPRNYPGIEGGARPLTLMQRLAAGFSSTEEGRENILGGMGGEGRAPEPISRPGKPDIAGRGMSDIFMAGAGRETESGGHGADFGEIDYRDLSGDIADEVGPSLAPIGGTIGGTVGFAAGGNPLTSLAGGGVGSAYGDVVRQGTANLLGAEEPFDPKQTLGEFALGLVGEAGPIGILGGRTLTKAIQKLFAPFRRSASFRQTRNIAETPLAPHINVSELGPRQRGTFQYAADQRRGPSIRDATGRADPGMSQAPRGQIGEFVDKDPDFMSAEELDRTLGTKLESTADVGSRTESPFLRQSEARIAGSPRHGDRFRALVREPRREAEREAFEKIAEQANIPLAAPSEGLSRLIKEAADETLKERKSKINDLFETFKTELKREFGDDPIAIDKTNMRSAFNDIKSKIGYSKTENRHLTAKTQEKLDLLEEDVDNLQNFGDLDDFRKAFGNLLDSEGALGEFKEVGLEGHLRKLYGGMVEDLDGSLRNAAASRGQVAPGIGAGSLIESRNIGDADRVIGLSREAKMSFEDLLALNSTTAQKVLRNPEKLDLVIDVFTGPTVTADMVKGFKQKIGAEATDRFRANEQGVEAWRSFQGAVLERLSNESILDSDMLRAIPIDGQKLLANIDKLGSDQVLKEIFPEQVVKQLKAVGHTIMAHTKSQTRSAHRIPDELQGIIMNDIFSTIKGLVTKRTDLILSPGLVGSETYKRWLTTGLGQGPIPQSIMSLIGRGVPQVGYRDLSEGALGDAYRDFAQGVNQTINPFAGSPPPGQ
tara:strand:+ start:3966 stop:6443 length:2478 start_codon:yes stop_codon:yes gene_type:complete